MTKVLISDGNLQYNEIEENNVLQPLKNKLDCDKYVKTLTQIRQSQTSHLKRMNKTYTFDNEKTKNTKKFTAVFN